MDHCLRRGQFSITCNVSTRLVEMKKGILTFLKIKYKFCISMNCNFSNLKTIRLLSITHLKKVVSLKIHTRNVLWNKTSYGASRCAKCNQPFRGQTDIVETYVAMTLGELFQIIPVSTPGEWMRLEWKWSTGVLYVNKALFETWTECKEKYKMFCEILRCVYIEEKQW